MEEVGQRVVYQRETDRAFVLRNQPPLDALWVHDLVRRDDATGLLTFLEPQWQAVLSRVRG